MSPQKTITALAAAAVIALPPLNAWAATRGNNATKPKKKVVSQTITVAGPSVQCKRWGQLVVAIKVKKTTTMIGKRKIVKVKILDVTWPTWPDATFRSVYINKQALPLLREDTLSLQSAKLEVISGATDITVSYKESLQAAILKAKK
jgi:uncharacterized protein with FMN-binding domain